MTKIRLVIYSGWLVVTALLLPVTASGVVLTVTADATVDNAFGEDYIPLNVPIHAEVGFDLAGSAGWNFATIAAASGAFTWNDGSDRTFNVTGATTGLSDGINGRVGVLFSGTGPTINGLDPSGFQIVFDVGLDPFSNTTPWVDHLLGATIVGFGYAAFAPSSIPPGFACSLCAETRVDGSITLAHSVPAPPTLALIAVGMMGGRTLRKWIEIESRVRSRRV